MKHRIAPLVAVLCLHPAARAAEPVLRQVVLSTAGTGQFVFDAAVTGRDTLSLDVPLDQVDDLLKSLSVGDPAGGAASVRLPGRTPLAETFRTLPFDAGAFASPEALLGALVGEEVRLPTPGLAGTVLAVNAFAAALPDNAGTVTRHRLTLATPAGLASVVLEEAGPVELVSDRLRAQIGTALAAIGASRVQDRRTLSVVLGDGGARTVRLGYVVAAPVWKASYRLILPAGADGAGPRLQGFAVLENLSGRDWRGVDVVLTSGQPVLYRQALYQPVMTDRPEAPVDVPNRLLPALDAGAVAAEPPAPPPPPVAPAPMLLGPGSGAAGPRPRGLAASAPAPAPPPPPAVAEAGVAQVRFHLSAPVDAPAGQSLLVPIVDRVMPGRRVALVRSDEPSPHPLVALLLRNDTAEALPPGLATLYEGAAATFTGDARLPAIPAGGERLATFAADLAVAVDVQAGGDARVVSLRAARGVLEVRRQERAVSTYRISTPADGGRTVLIEQARRPGWTLVDPAGVAGADTPTHHRLTVEVPAGTTQTVRVVLQAERETRVALTDAAPAVLAGLSTDGNLSGPVRDALARAAALREEVDRRGTELAGLRTRRDALAADQDRVRRNLAAVPAGDLQRRYLSQLQSQEDGIAALDRQAADAGRAADAAGAALRDYLANLTI